MQFHTVMSTSEILIRSRETLPNEEHIFAGDLFAALQAVSAFNVLRLLTLFATLAASVRDSIKRVVAVSVRTFASDSTARVNLRCAPANRFSQ